MGNVIPKQRLNLLFVICYDDVVNRISMTENGVETTYIYNSLNQLLSSTENGETTAYTYDGRGNQITETKGNTVTESTYSVRGEMVSLTKKNGNTVLFSQDNQYNYDGIRISKKEDVTNRHYYYDNGVISYTKDGTTLSSANVTGPEGQVVGTYRGDDYHIYLKDIQGSTTNIVKQDGSLSAAYEYSDFGETEEITGSSFDNEICYTGAIYDDTTGLYYMNARYYDPVNGRFISQDTYRGEVNDPAQWHLYAYCANNPINYVDPSGHARNSSNQGTWEYNKVMYSIKFGDLWDLAESYRTGTRTFDKVDVAVSTALTIAGVFISPEAIAIAAITYTIVGYGKSYKSTAFYKTCYNFYKKKKDTYKSKKTIYITEEMKRLKPKKYSKSNGSNWKMHGIVVSGTKPKGFKAGKRKGK